MSLGAGFLCWKYKAHGWISNITATYDSMIAVHFTAVGALAVFATSVVFIFKEKQWTDKKRDWMGEYIETNITSVLLKSSDSVGEDGVDYTAFVDTVKRHAVVLDEKMRRLYLLFVWCIFLIFTNCMLSVVFAYHARLLVSPRCYVSSYIFAASALILIALHAFIVFLPAWVERRLYDELSLGKLKIWFKLYQEQMNGTKNKSDSPDLGFRFPDR